MLADVPPGDSERRMPRRGDGWFERSPSILAPHRGDPVTVDVRLLLDKRTEQLAVRIEDLERAVEALNCLVADLLGEWTHRYGPLPQQFGQNHTS